MPLEAEWVLSETMTRFLDNFNLLRMFRVARIIRSRAAMSSQAKPHMILLLADLKKMQPLYAIIIIRCHYMPLDIGTGGAQLKQGCHTLASFFSSFGTLGDCKTFPSPGPFMADRFSPLDTGLLKLFRRFSYLKEFLVGTGRVDSFDSFVGGQK